MDPSNNEMETAKRCSTALLILSGISGDVNCFTSQLFDFMLNLQCFYIQTFFSKYISLYLAGVVFEVWFAPGTMCFTSTSKNGFARPERGSNCSDGVGYDK